jgi:hypothetical protein
MSDLNGIRYNVLIYFKDCFFIWTYINFQSYLLTQWTDFDEMKYSVLLSYKYYHVCVLFTSVNVNAHITFGLKYIFGHISLSINLREKMF